LSLLRGGAPTAIQFMTAAEPLMPTYHFNLDNSHREPDTEGTELGNLDEARVQAVIFAGAHLRDHPELVWDGKRFSVDVTDDEHRILFSVLVETKDAA
jgi:hypothetical protein